MPTSNSNIHLNDILEAISRADDWEISEIIAAIVRRYGKVFPDWEVIFYSLPKDPSQRKAAIDDLLRILNAPV